MARFVWNLLLLALVGVLLALIFSLGGLYYFGRDLPDYKQLARYDPPVVTRLYAADGRLFAEYATERRVFVPIHAIPERVVQTFLAAEDKNFYTHTGIDISSIFRALVTNVAHMGSNRRPVGGSTITQQVAKNFLLTREQSFTRKIKEAILAFRIEHTYSKEKILELYLNELYLGGGAYGVAAASLHYFNKSLSELTPAEAAYLAALPKAPENYNPRKHPERAIARRNWVVGRMVEEGIITAEEGDVARGQPIKLVEQDEAESVSANYYAEEVRRELIEKYGSSVLYEGGLTVKTALDPRLQKIADRVLREGLIAYDRRKGWRGPLAHMDAKNWEEEFPKVTEFVGVRPWATALVLAVKSDSVEIGFKNGKKGTIPMDELKWARPYKRDNNDMPVPGPEPKTPGDVLKVGDVIAVQHLEGGVYGLRQVPNVGGAILAMDPHTGRVLAMTGGFSYEMSEFNRATQALRQPGSAFKGFVYLTALERGWTPASPLLDAPITMHLPGGKVWQPVNAKNKFYGLTTLRRAFEDSYNLATIRLAMQVGMKPIAEVAERLGVIEKLPHQLAMVLGAGETTLLKMSSAYAMMVNGGKKITPIFIDRIQDRQGKTIFTHDPRTCEKCDRQAWVGQKPPILQDVRQQMINPGVAYQMVSMMEGAVTRGTAIAAAVPGKTLGGKTGSTNEWKDAWFIGFSPDLLVGVFIGFDQPKPLGYKEFGGTLAAPFFKKFMEEALKDRQTVSFRVPPEVVFVKVPTPASPDAPAGARAVVSEVFRPGTEPGSAEAHVKAMDAALANEPLSISASQLEGFTPEVLEAGGLY